MDSYVKLLHLSLCVLFTSQIVFGVVDQDGYDKSENRLCEGTLLSTYNHTGDLPMDVPDCTQACQAQTGCLAFSADLLSEQCLLFGSCDTKVENGRYTTYAAVYCGDPPGVANARPTVAQFYYNNRANYECLSGYSMVNSDSISCAANGSWAGSEPTCEYQNYYRCKQYCVIGGNLTCPAGYVLDIIYHNYGFVNGRNCTIGSQPDCLNYESNDYVKINCNDQNTCDLEEGVGPVPNGSCVMGIPLTEYKCVGPSRANVEECYADCAAADVGNSTNVLNYTAQGAQREYTCDPGYEFLDGNVTKIVLCDEGSVSGELPTCSPINCPTIELGNGSLSTQSTIYETNVTFICDEGYMISGDSFATCQADETWSAVGSCIPVDCGTFESANANVDFSLGTTYTLTVTISCETGYEIGQGSGNVSVVSTCQGDGSWSEESNCTLMDCGPAPAMDENGSINFVASTVNTTYGQQLEYFCDEGYLPPEIVITCGSDGAWDNSHTCTAVECPIVTTYDFVSSVTATNGRSYLSVATVTCDEGYEFLPDNQTTCEQDAQWSPSVVCQKVDCGQPNEINNAEPLTVTDTLYEAQVNYTCLPGYEVGEGFTTSSFVCTAAGTWSNILGCSPVQCQEPTSVDEGVISYTATDLTSYQSVATIQCRDGYEFLPNSITTCQSDKTWDPPIVCQKKNCSTPFVLANAVMDAPPEDTLFGAVVNYTCLMGYETSAGNPTTSSICEADSSWSTLDACDPVDCGIPQAITGGAGGPQYTSTTLGSEVIYECAPDYVLVGQSNGTCTAYKVWSISPPSCELITCPPISPGPGQAGISQAPVRTFISYQCDPGFYLVGQENITCLSNGSWDYEVPRCDRISCGSPATVLNGTEVINEGFLYQDTITYQCDLGFEQSAGDTSITCQADGSWSGTTLECARVNCGPPGDALNTLPVVVTDTLFGDTVNYQCLTGYVISEGVTTGDIVCQANATWSQKPDCLPVQCSDPVEIDGVVDYTATDGRNYQSVATIQCTVGYECPPNAITLCQSDQTWSPPISCQKVNCSTPIVLANAEMDAPPADTLYGAVVNYTCILGHETSDGNTTTSSTCNADGSWSTPHACQIVDCGTPAGLTSGPGGPQYRSTTFGSEVIYQCEPDYFLAGEANGTCTESKTWSISPPSCELIICPSISSGPGQSGISSAKVGTVLSYECDPGFNLIGQENITCLDNGTWDYNVPRCDRISCGSPGTIVNGTEVVNEGFLYEDTITYQCDLGYEQSAGDTSVTCQADGSWSGATLECAKVNCGSPPVNGRNGLQVIEGTFYNDTVTYSCQEGYKFRFRGENVNKCTSSGAWLISTAPDCEIMDCGDPDIVILDGTAEYTETTYESAVTYKCNEGYLPIITTYYCNASETWNGTVPVCEAVNCSKIVEQIANGVPTEPVVGQSVQYSCNNGYNLNGVATLTCTSYGNWSAPVPTCDPVDCGQVSTTLENGIVVVMGTTFTEQVTYTCNNGYLLNGNSTCTCTAEGTWSDTPPTCLALNEVRVLTTVTTSLDCNDYTETTLAAILEAAKTELPTQLLPVLQSVPADQLFNETIVILGLSCNSPLQFLLEVVADTTETISTVEQMLADSLTNLTTTSVQLQVDGNTLNIGFTNVNPSVNTGKLCGQGYFTNVDSLDCVPCPRNTYQPTGVQELCLDCPLDYTTKGEATYGERNEVCQSPEKTSAKTLGLAIGVPVGVLLLLFICIILYCVVRKPRYPHDELSESDTRSHREIYDSRHMKYGNPYYRYASSFGKHFPYRF